MRISWWDWEWCVVQAGDGSPTQVMMMTMSLCHWWWHDGRMLYLGDGSLCRWWWRCLCVSNDDMRVVCCIGWKWVTCAGWWVTCTGGDDDAIDGGWWWWCAMQDGGGSPTQVMMMGDDDNVTVSVMMTSSTGLRCCIWEVGHLRRWWWCRWWRWWWCHCVSNDDILCRLEVLYLGGESPTQVIMMMSMMMSLCHCP